VSTISKYLSDTSFLEKTFAYLRNIGVYALLVDENGQAEQQNVEVPRFPAKKYYPIEFDIDVGGIRCFAATEAILIAAEPHINYSVQALQELLLKEWILKQTSDEMLELSSQLYFLLNLANKVAGIQNLREYCTVALREISEAVSADCAMTYIRGKNSGKSILIPHEMGERKAESFRKNIAEIQREPGKRTIIVTLEDGTSALIAPIREKERQAGYMAFFKGPDKRFFTSYENKFVGVIDNIISPTVEGLRLYESLLKSLAKAIDAKDPYTHGHSSRVAQYATSIGRQLGVPCEKLDELEMAANMHDLGKIGVPESILAKPGRLTPQEFEEVKKHPIKTDEILKPLDLPQYVVDAAVQHHERMNGCGYPLGLKGESISPFARIIAVADVFDALTSTRHYRDAMTVEAALEILYEGVNSSYDRNVVLALVSALQNEKNDQDLSQLYPSLRFFNIEQISHVLENLAEQLKDSPVMAGALK
jgi:HD-GYP domain-containing protein (c-di-GMP phosphodiesterase class II)